MAAIPINLADIRRAYLDALQTVGESVVLREQTAPGVYTNHTVRGLVRTYRAQDIVPGGSLQLGDLTIIVLREDYPLGVRRLERKDRVLVRGREYAVVNYDDATRSVNGTVYAVDILVRG
jgi:hypothetical protein